MDEMAEAKAELAMLASEGACRVHLHVLCMHYTVTANTRRRLEWWELTCVNVSMCMYIGKIKYTEDIREGLETYPATVRLLMSGDNTGKLILKVWETAYNGERTIYVYMYAYMFLIAVNWFLRYFMHLFCTCGAKRFWLIRPSFNKSLKTQQLPTRRGKQIRKSLFFRGALSWRCSAAPQKWEAKIAHPLFE